MLSLQPGSRLSSMSPISQGVLDVRRTQPHVAILEIELVQREVLHVGWIGERRIKIRTCWPQVSAAVKSCSWLRSNLGTK